MALARLLHDHGADDEALEVLRPVSGGFRADGLAARIRLDRLRDPDLAAGLAALDADSTEPALELLLSALTVSPEDRTPDVRQLIVSELDALGFGHPLLRAWRGRLPPG